MRRTSFASDRNCRFGGGVGADARLRYICTTGGKATEILLDIQGGGIKMPKTGETVPFPFAGRDLTLTRLPSTSRAYPLSLAKKAAAYRAFFEMAGLV